jgi:signal transduction histidine kinase
VEDTGPGIDPKNYSRIFDAFVTTKSKGTGLGLAISQMIVDRHGGQIVVMPGSGNGARFQVTLPVQLAVVSSQAAE